MIKDEELLAIKNEWITLEKFQKDHKDVFPTLSSLRWFIRINSEVMTEERVLAKDAARRLLIHPKRLFIARNRVFDLKPMAAFKTPKPRVSEAA